MGCPIYVKFKSQTNKKQHKMKATKTIQPSRLWYVTSIKNLEKIKKEGIYGYGSSLKLIHKLQFGFYPFEKSDYYSSADCLGIRVVESKNNLQYALIEIAPEGLNNRLRRCHTEGVVVSKCVYTSDIFHIEPEYVIGYEIRTIDLDNLLFFSEYRLREAMDSELIQSKQPGCGIDPKEIAQNNRILNERYSAICFNISLFNLVYGDYQSNFFDSLGTKEAVKQVNAA
jgi:hypothetical protein